MNPQIIATHLRERRKLLNIRQGDLAEVLGMELTLNVKS